MKRETPIVTRCLALVMALAMFFTCNANLGLALQVFAAEGSQSITASELMVENYDALSDAEKALLRSGHLAGDATYSYKLPGALNEDDLVSVDYDGETKNGTITAAVYDGEWVPTQATIIVGGVNQDPIALNANGSVYTGAFTCEDGAFSVEVAYSLDKTVSEAVQNDLMDTLKRLHQGYQNMVTVKAQDSDLDLLEQAMGYLVEAKAAFSTDGQNAIDLLNGQMTANGGKLNLRSMIASAGNEVQYLVQNGSALEAELKQTHDAVAAICADMGTADFSSLDPISQLMLNVLKATLDKLEAGLNIGNWVSVDASELNADTPEAWADLNALVKALSGVTTITPVEKLHCADTTVSATVNMYNVTVKVTLNTCQSNVVSEYDTVSEVVTLAAASTAQQIENAVNAAVNDILAQWSGVYAAEHFDATADTMPTELTGDMTYNVSYSPKKYEVTYSYQASELLPYGYVVTLPVHGDEDLAYDYTVNSVAYEQGAKYTVSGATAIARTEGKAYYRTDLYTIVGNNYGNTATQGILGSGALKNNTVVKVRMPDAALLNLEGGTLTAVNGDSSYNGLQWAPYAYGATADALTGSFNGNTAAWTDNSAWVQYILELDVTPAEAQSILDLAKTLDTEAAAQLNALQRMAGYYKDLNDLNKSMLGGLNGTIAYTDLTPGDGDENDAKCLELRAYFTDLVGSILDEETGNMDGSNLKLRNMVANFVDVTTDPETGSITAVKFVPERALRYYFENSEAFRAEVADLNGKLHSLYGDDEKEQALGVILEAVNKSAYKEKITNLGTAMQDVLAGLSIVNSAIDVNSDKLGTLVTALVNDTVENQTAATPYLLSEALYVMADTVATIQVNVVVNGAQPVAVNIGEQAINTVVTEKMIADLKAAVEAKVGEDLPYCNLTVKDSAGNAASLDDLIGKELSQTLTYTYTYTYKQYTVNVEGMEDQTISLNNMEIRLAASNNDAWEYKYVIDGKEVAAGPYTFTKDQLALFQNGSYSVSRNEIDLRKQQLESAFAGIGTVTYDASTNAPIVTVNLAASQNSVMDLANALLKSGYSYIGLNTEGLMYMNSDNKLELSLQTLIDAMLADEAFSGDMLFELANNGKGAVLHATMQVGDDVNSLHYDNIDFVLNLTSVPAKAVEYLGYLEQVKNYVVLEGDAATRGNGVLDLELNLPEKVYEVYLTAMIAEGTVDIDNAAAVDKYIAVHFIADYVAMVTESGATTTTFKNTIEMLYQLVEKASNVTEGVDKIPDVSVDPSDLPNTAVVTNYEAYYQWLKNTINDATYNETTGTIDALLSANGTTVIDKLLALAGVSADSFSTELAMVKEYTKGDDLAVNVSVDLNADHEFEALVIDSAALKDGAKALKPLLKQLNTNMTPAELMDWAVEVKATGLHTGIDYTSDLPARAAAVKGGAVVVLLDDTNGVTFNGTTILDLNGMTVNGNIVANGPLYIMDSSLDTNNGGKVTGTVSGSDVTIVGGTYAGDVAAYLPDGYVQDNGSVHNCMYTIDVDGNGNLTFEINADYMYECDGYLPSVKALAADIALELAMNFYPAASLSVDGCEFYNISNSTQLTDLLKLALDANSVEYLIDEALLTLSVPGMADFINIVMEDLLDFENIATNLNNDSAFASYTLKAAPYAVTVDHITGDDYMTVGVAADADNSKSATVSLKMVGANAGKLTTCFSVLDAVVEEASIKLVNVKDLTYDAKNFDLSGGVEASASLDLTSFTEQVMVVLAHGLYNDGNTANDAKADAIIAALNDAYGEGGSAITNALHDAFNALTAEEVLTALKVLNHEDTLESIYAGLKQDHGLEITYAEYNATVEKAIVVALSAVGKMMEELAINGSSSDLMEQIETMADAEDACHDVVSYAHSITYNRSSNVAVTEVLNFLNTHGINVIRYLDAYGINVDGYGVNLNLTTSKASLNVKLFDKCAHDWVTVDPTCSNDGTVTNGYMECTHCGEYIVILGSHDFGDAHDWKCDGENHWRECTVCGYIAEKGAHVPGAWIVTKQPSTTDYGWEEQYCAICGKHLKSRSIDKLVVPTTPTTPTSPVTADTFNVYLWGTLTVVSGAAVVGLFAWKKRKFFEK